MKKIEIVCVHCNSNLSLKTDHVFVENSFCMNVYMCVCPNCKNKTNVSSYILTEKERKAAVKKAGRK